MPPLPPDPYKALGVPKGASITDIRTAYRKLVLTCHPDKVHDPTQKAEKLEEFQKIQHAYELLSDDKERAKYDQQVTYMELRKAVPRNVPNTSAPRTPKTHTRVHVYTTAEPRPSPYAQSPPQAGARVYAQYSPASNEEFGFADDEGTGRSSKRAQSHEKAASRKEKELEEEKERERADRARRRREKEEAQEEREKEKEKEREQREQRERERRLSDKESRKAEKKRQDKERKQAHEEKHRNRSGAYVEEYTSDKDTVRPEKKKSSSRKTRDRERERESTPKLDGLVEKTNDQRMRAEEYIKRRANIDRSATADATTFRNSPPSVPTPPPPRDSAYAPPPPPEDEGDGDDDDDEEEPVHHPRAGSRRGSYDPSRSREPGFMHKRSFPSVIDDTVHLSSSPGRLSSMPTESPPRGSLPKSGTFHESPRSAARPIPSMPRSHTFAAGETYESRHSRGRSRSRFQSQRVPEMEEEDEVEMRQHLKGYRSRRESATDPIPIHPSSKHYEGRSLGRESSYRDPFERSPKYFTSSGSSEYIESAYSYPRAHYPKVKTAKRYDESEVNMRRYGETMPYEINTYH